MASLTGYHGTHTTNAQRIMQTGFRKPTKVGWCGTGIYFFKDNDTLARQFAARTFGTKQVSVIRCQIDVPDDRILDLRDPESIGSQKFHIFYAEFVRKLQRSKLNAGSRTKDDEDGSVINSMCISDGYELVVHNTYTAPDEDTYRRRSRVANGTELCLRNAAYIQDKDIV